MSAFFDSETNLIFNLLTKGKIEASLVGNCRWERFLRLASVNRVLYFVCKKIKNSEGLDISTAVEDNIETIFLQGREEIQKATRTLAFLTETFEGVGLDFLVVKTLKEFPYVFNDIDIVVRGEDYQEARAALEQRGGLVSLCEPKRQADVHFKEYIKIDLHQGFHWQNSEYLDLDFVWSKPRKRKYLGGEFFVPNDSVEWSLTVLNILFERYSISFNDLFFLKRRLGKIDSQEIRDQAKKYGWDNSLDEFLEILTGLEGNERFPYILPSRYMFRVFWEGLRKRRSVKLFQMVYYVFAKIRFYLTDGRRVPVYGDWFNFERLKW